MEQSKSVRIFRLKNYNFGVKDPQREKDSSVQNRMARRKIKYESQGMRSSVDGVMLVHRHGHPHVLLMQIGTFFKLPGGSLKPGEDDKTGLIRQLVSKLGPVGGEVDLPDWEVNELLGNWWRPNFENCLYPYNPPHITKPKECKKIYLVTLPEKCSFSVPKNYKLLAVPLFELYDNPQRYGTVISSIPIALSHFTFNTL